MKTLVVVALFASVIAHADPVIHGFKLWGLMETDELKWAAYVAWTNGFLPGKGAPGVKFIKCLEGVDSKQAIAMVDKFFKNNPEKWSTPFNLGMVEALTVKGGPCEGLDPLAEPGR